jgi:hypothetical protein
LQRKLKIEPAVEHHEGVELDEDPKDESTELKDVKHAKIFQLFKLPLDEEYVDR